MHEAQILVLVPLTMQGLAVGAQGLQGQMLRLVVRVAKAVMGWPA